MKKNEYKNSKRDYDEIYFPLAEKAAEIREKGTSASQEEKDLTELISNAKLSANQQTAESAASRKLMLEKMDIIKEPKNKNKTKVSLTQLFIATFF